MLIQRSDLNPFCTNLSPGGDRGAGLSLRGPGGRQNHGKAVEGGGGLGKGKKGSTEAAALPPAPEGTSSVSSRPVVPLVVRQAPPTGVLQLHFSRRLPFIVRLETQPSPAPEPGS